MSSHSLEQQLHEESRENEGDEEEKNDKESVVLLEGSTEDAIKQLEQEFNASSSDSELVSSQVLHGSNIDQVFHQQDNSESPVEEMKVLHIEDEYLDTSLTTSFGYEARYKPPKQSDFPSTKQENELAVQLRVPSLSTCDSNSEQEDSEKIKTLEIEGQDDYLDTSVTLSPGYRARHKPPNESCTKQESVAVQLPSLSSGDSSSEQEDSVSPVEEMKALDIEGHDEHLNTSVTLTHGYEARHKPPIQSDLPSTKQENELAVQLRVPSLSTCDSNSEQEDSEKIKTLEIEGQDDYLDTSVTLSPGYRARHKPPNELCTKQESVAVQLPSLSSGDSSSEQEDSVSPVEEMKALDIEGHDEHLNTSVTLTHGYEARHKPPIQSDLPSTKQENELAVQLRVPSLSTCDSNSEQEEEPSQVEDEERIILDQKADDFDGDQARDKSHSDVDLPKFKHLIPVNQRPIAQCRHLHTCIQAAASRINDATKDRSTQRVTRLTKLIPRDPGKVIGKFDCAIYILSVIDIITMYFQTSTVSMAFWLFVFTNCSVRGRNSGQTYQNGFLMKLLTPVNLKLEALSEMFLPEELMKLWFLYFLKSLPALTSTTTLIF